MYSRLERKVLAKHLLQYFSGIINKCYVILPVSVAPQTEDPKKLLTLVSKPTITKDDKFYVVSISSPERKIHEISGFTAERELLQRHPHVGWVTAVSAVARASEMGSAGIFMRRMPSPF
jgi:hypothetical protein